MYLAATSLMLWEEEQRVNMDTEFLRTRGGRLRKLSLLQMHDLRETIFYLSHYTDFCKVVVAAVLLPLFLLFFFSLFLFLVIIF